MNIKKHIPNMLTVGNLLSGSLAIVFTLHSGRPEVAMWLIVLAAVFDFFDGMVARLLGVSSPIGKDLDSLAFKLSKAPLSEKWPQLALIIIAVGSVIGLGWMGCSVTIIAYLILSLVAPASDKQA